MSKPYPRSIRMEDQLWEKLNRLAKIGGTSRNTLVIQILEKAHEVLTRDFDLTKTEDRNKIKKILEREVL